MQTHSFNSSASTPIVTGMERQTDEDSDDDGKPVLFRSYAPLDSGLGTKRETKNLFVLEKEIQDQLADTDDMSIVERVDVGVLAPRKVKIGIFISFQILSFKINVAELEQLRF